MSTLPTENTLAEDSNILAAPPVGLEASVVIWLVDFSCGHEAQLPQQLRRPLQSGQQLCQSSKGAGQDLPGTGGAERSCQGGQGCCVALEGCLVIGEGFRRVF